MSGPQEVAALPRPSLEVSVLGPTVVLTTGNLPPEQLNGRVTHPLVALLVSRPAGAVFSLAEINRWTGTHRDTRTLHQQISRLRRAGLPAEPVIGVGYRLKQQPDRVDMSEFLDAGGKALRLRTAQAARTALALWAGDLPNNVLDAPIFDAVLSMRLQLRQLAAVKPRRVLVVEDMVGEELRQLLRTRYPGEIEVVVAPTAERFADFERRLDEFDLILLDYHLTPGSEGFQGLDLAQRIRAAPAAVPVLGMSYRRSPGSDTAIALALDMWDFVQKESPADFRALDDVVDRALGILLSDETDLLKHYEVRVDVLRSEALNVLRTRGGGAAEQTRMEADVTELKRVAARKDLWSLRARSHRFHDRWVGHIY